MDKTVEIRKAIARLEKQIENFIQLAPAFNTDTDLAREIGKAIADLRTIVG